MNRKIRQIIINQAAQGLIGIKQAVKWFEQLSAEEKTLTLRDLALFSWQAHVLGKDGIKALEVCGIRPTFTPCVLLKKAADEDPDGEIIIRRMVGKIVNLPAHESTKSFRVLTALLSVGEKNRRDRTGIDAERYWWHQDLSNYDILEKILEKEITQFPLWVFAEEGQNHPHQK